jgi:phospho-N-acetylmuramoyl-pentapeptide-transferase
MMYYLLVPLAAHISALNVFRYITFRSIAALVTALVLSILLGPRAIAWLTRLKCGQYIHEDVAAHQCKAGTPTMGGLLIGFCIVASVLLWGDLANGYVWMTIFVFCGFGVLGFVDDHAKVVRKRNRGLSPKGKLLGQILVAGVAAAILLSDPEYSTRLAVPFFKHINPDLGWMYFPFAMLVMIAASNAVNLTDGLDGLAIGPMIVNAAMFALFVYVAGHAQMARYLQVAPVSGWSRGDGLLRRHGRGRARLFVVQRLFRPRFSWAMWVPCPWGSARVPGGFCATGTAAHRCWRPVRGRDGLGHSPVGYFR